MPSISTSPSHKRHTKHVFTWKHIPQPLHLDLAYVHYDALQRQQSQKRKPRFRAKKEGSLSSFMLMPVDILYEVVTHLHPQDALNLSRSTHRLRQLLMTRNARSIWKSTLSNVEGLPACPSDLNEPQFASLAFDEHCHLCLAPRVKNVLWSCRVRSCRDCLPKCFLTMDQLACLLPETLDIPKLETIFMHTVLDHPKINSANDGTVLFYKPVAEAYLQELFQLDENDKLSLSRWCHRKRIILERTMAHAALCEHWSCYWTYSDVSHQLCDVGFTLCLLVLLVFLWKDRLFY